jgi:exosortase/archaeosortase family protein
VSSQPQLHPRLGSFSAPQSALLALFLSLGAVAADQFFAPILYTSSPLWALLACLLLIWRADESGTGGQNLAKFSLARLALFSLAHLSVIAAAYWLGSTAAGTVRLGATGWLLAALKLWVLLPTLLLFDFPTLKSLARRYASEFFAALFVLTTFFPTRVMESIWPWYGQILGRVVYGIAGVFAPVAAYHPGLAPTVSGPELDVTILYSCSGLNGLQLFDILFALVVVVDWNRLLKKRALIGYFGGLGAMLVANALRIASLYVLGNRGFADFVARFHISAGWIFFTAVFLAYLALIYGWMLAPGVQDETEALRRADFAHSPAVE